MMFCPTTSGKKVDTTVSTVPTTHANSAAQTIPITAPSTLLRKFSTGRWVTRSSKYITNVKLFDIYEGAQIGEDKKSMAFTVLFTPKDEAFTAESVDGFVKKILKQMNKKFGAELRS